MSQAAYYWIAAPFLTALVSTFHWGVRGAIVMFGIGLVVPVVFTMLTRPGLSVAAAVGFSAFEIAYWWMATYVAAAMALVLRPHLDLDDRP